jgi:hypothetical protein
MAWARSSSEPTVPTECASGVVASQIPGSDPDPDGIGPVFVDATLSKIIYGDSVNVLDGISAEEAPAVKEIAARVQWCFVYDPVEGDHWEAFIPGFDAP